MFCTSLFFLYRIHPSYVHIFLKPNFSLASFKTLIRYPIRFSVILIFFSLSFFLLLKTFLGILYRTNLTITGLGFLFESHLLPILCLRSKSTNNTSSFSSYLNGFKTLSSLLFFFSSFNPWIKIQFLLEYCPCVSSFFSTSSTLILALSEESLWKVELLLPFHANISHAHQISGLHNHHLCQIS